MSDLHVRKCDNCDKEQRDGTGEYHVWYDPDKWDGWWHLGVSVWDSKESYDFCSLECVSAWVEKRKLEIAEAETMDGYANPWMNPRASAKEPGDV